MSETIDPFIAVLIDTKIQGLTGDVHVRRDVAGVGPEKSIRFLLLAARGC
jgi:hypothetical protein